MIRTSLTALALLVVAAVPALASPKITYTVPATPTPDGAYLDKCEAVKSIGKTCTRQNLVTGFLVTYLQGDRPIYYGMMMGAGVTVGGAKNALLSSSQGALADGAGNYCIENKPDGIGLVGQTAHAVEPAIPCAE